MKSPKDCKRTELLNIDPTERVQDCDRWKHVLASVLPERPRGTYFFNRLFEAIWATNAADVLDFGKAYVGMLADACDSWQNCCELWAACFIVGSMSAKLLGQSPEWIEKLQDMAADELEENWKDDRREWASFINGMNVRIEK